MYNNNSIWRSQWTMDGHYEMVSPFLRGYLQFSPTPFSYRSLLSTHCKPNCIIVKASQLALTTSELYIG